MFENLLKLVQENAGEAIVNNAAIPNEHNNAAISTTAGGIMDHLKGLTAGGGVEKILSMFNGKDTDNQSELASMSSNVAGSLMSKFGLNAEQAGDAVKSLIPTVMNKLIGKTNDPNDNSFDIQGIIGSLTGGQAGGIGGMFDKVKNIF